jgi:hypothetical protein
VPPRRLVGYSSLLVLVRLATGAAPAFAEFPRACEPDKVRYSRIISD